MARSFQQMIILGNLGKDPEVRYTANGTAVATLTVATTDNGQDHYIVEIVADSMTIIGARESNREGPADGPVYQSQGGDAPAPQYQGNMNPDDDIPM